MPRFVAVPARGELGDTLDLGAGPEAAYKGDSQGEFERWSSRTTMRASTGLRPK